MTSSSLYTTVLTELVLPISSSYYNAQINKWEPILEKIHFSVKLKYDPRAKPNLVLDLENEVSTANLNINLSTEMVKSVLKGIKFIKESEIFQRVKDKKNFQNVQESNPNVKLYDF